MIKLSNFKSSDSRISFNIQVDTSLYANVLPKRTDYFDLKELYQKFSRELQHLQKIVSTGNLEVSNYREERLSSIARLTELNNDLFDLLASINKEIGAEINEKSIITEKSYCVSNIENLSNLKNEYEILALTKSRVSTFLNSCSEGIETKIKFFNRFRKSLDYLLKGDLKAGIILEGESDHVFEVYGLAVQADLDSSLDIAAYKRYLSKTIGLEIGAMINDLTEKKRALKGLIVRRFNPWETFEDILTVEEFLKARAEVANFWNEEFSFTENLAHHYFKSQGFYQFFEEKLLEKLNSIRTKIDHKIQKIQSQYQLNESVLGLYGHMTVSEFLKGASLRVVSEQGIPKSRHHSFNILKAINEKLAGIIWNETEKNIARKLGGMIASPGVIVRPNRQDNKATMRSEVIVISSQSNDTDPKILLKGKFSDLIATKSENLTELVEIEHKPEGLTVDLDLKLSYYLSTTKAA